jgi:hypothetical protein
MARPVHQTGRRRSTTESSTLRCPSSWARRTSRIEEAPTRPFHRLGTGCGGAGRDPLKRVGPAMEGTSGAADRALLRGRACEAALSCEGPRQRAPGRADARASDCEVDSCREANQLPMTPASPGGGSSRVCDRRCPSRQGWGEASTASDRGGRSCPRDLNSLRMAPDPRDLDWPTTKVARPSAARLFTER